MKLGVLFGGASNEHIVSISSACSIINNLDKDNYKIYPIYINKNNDWYLVLEDMPSDNFGYIPKVKKKIRNVFSYLKKMDCIIPVFHGKYGEDGTIQGLLEMLNIPYVGCKVLASSICIDKMYTKYVLKSAQIPVVDAINIKYKDNKFYNIKGFNYEEINIIEIDKLIKETINYPVFIKPSKLGSSVGVKKVNEFNELIDALYEANKLDENILIEKNIIGQELECAILNGIPSVVGEIKAADEFYSYDAKYNNKESTTKIPAQISEETMEEIKKIASKAFRVINGTGLARIDFFLEKDTNKIYVNEINTFPGFTAISMYPKLIEYSGTTISNLLDTLISLALNDL